MIATLDTIHHLAENGKGATKSSISALSGLPTTSVGKALEEAKELGWVVTASGVRNGWALSGEGKAIGANEVEVEIVFDSSYVDVRGAGTSSTEQEEPSTKSKTINLLDVSGVQDSRYKACEELVNQIGWGIVKQTKTETFVVHEGKSAKIQLYPVKGDWTAYLFKLRGSDSTMEELRDEFGMGEVKSSYVVIKQVNSEIDLKQLKDIL